MSNGPVGENVYHYTTIEALKSIVENRTLRLTDYRFLNDPQEIVYCIDPINRILEKYDQKDKLIVDLKRIVNNMKNNVFDFVVMTKRGQGKKEFKKYKNENGHIYLFSLTHKEDDLDMWSMYGKMGCRLKFNDVQLIENVLSNNGIIWLDDDIVISANSITGGVFYCDDFTNIENYIDFLLENREGVDLNIQNMLLGVIGLRKNPAYSYEHEVRVGLCVPDGIDQIDKNKVFTIKNNTIKPQLELKGVPIEKILQDVVISPYNTNDCAKCGIEEFLEYHLKVKVPVYNSKINIRE